jgi:hypothetical protein
VVTVKVTAPVCCSGQKMHYRLSTP